MNARHKKTKRRLQRAIDKWMPLLDLPGITVKHLFLPIRHDDGNLADTTANWQYREASIRYYLPDVCDHSDDQLELLVVHELAHVLVAPMESLVTTDNDRCEFAVESVARALVKAWK